MFDNCFCGGVFCPITKCPDLDFSNFSCPNFNCGTITCGNITCGGNICSEIACGSATCDQFTIPTLKCQDCNLYEFMDKNCGTIAQNVPFFIAIGGAIILLILILIVIYKLMAKISDINKIEAEIHFIEDSTDNIEMTTNRAQMSRPLPEQVATQIGSPQPTNIENKNSGFECVLNEFRVNLNHLKTVEKKNNI